MRNKKIYENLIAKKPEDLNSLEKDLLEDWGKEDVCGPWTEHNNDAWDPSVGFKFYKKYYLITYNDNKPAKIDSLFKPSLIKRIVKKIFKMKKKEEKKQEVEMDLCVLCGKETKYPKNMHVDYRMNFVDGAGQLCDDCAKKV